MTSFDSSAFVFLHVLCRFRKDFTKFYFEMVLVQMKVVYSYYSTERVTPIFVSEEELLDLNYDAFKWEIVKEIPYLGKITDTTTLRLTVLDHSYQVDILPAYFQHQIKGVLERTYSTKAIEFKAVVFDSPGVASPPRKKG